MTDLTRILFVGDIELGGEFADHYYNSRSDSINPFAELHPLFDRADLTVGNLESPLAKGNAPRKKKNLLHASPQAVRFLDYLGFSCLNMANNHITDQGVEGIAKTRELLKKYGIECFGAGPDIETATKPAMSRHREQTFGFLGYAVPGKDVGAVIAGQKEYGCAPFAIDQVVKDVASLSSQVSHVIVSLHWGYQFDQLPLPEQVAMARRIVDAGALIVHGHHPHIIQGVEQYQNGLIMYSMGNFIFPNFLRQDGVFFRFPKKTRRTIAVMCEVDESGVRSHTVYPLRVSSSYRMKLSRGGQHVLDMKTLSSITKILSADNYDQYWKKHHDKTRHFREKQERLLSKGAQRLCLREKIRSEGFSTLLKKARNKRLGELIQIFRRYISVLFS